MSAGRGPSYEELAALVVRQAERIERLEAEVAELKRLVGQNSRNSSKPPSSDSPFVKPAPKSLRRKSGMKPGGQPGHPGSTLALVDNPNERERHEPGPCRGCGANLANAPEVGMERRQVFDLPPVTVRVTEHQLIARRCACGTTTCGAAPEGVTAPVQYGPRITAIILYLYVGQFLSKKRTAQALAELFGSPVSEGTVATMAKRAADGLDGFLSEVTDRIAESEVAGFDETGLRVAGRLHWVHCARTGKYTLITCHPKRGSEGIDDAGVLSRFRGVAVHDAWAPYDSYVDVEHQLCCAHALRELQAVADTMPDADWCWATQAADALVAMQKLVGQAIATGADAIDPDALAEQVRHFRSAVQIGITSTAARSNKVMKKHNALARRLTDRQDDYLRFTIDWRIPADNNGSERDIRMIKLRQKVSGCLRSLTGAKQFCAIRSHLSTAAKHGRNFFDTLIMLADGHPWLPAHS
ncbi:IS66 family transposase [Amycolatopsis panacis]|uniref:IS66 family transposase n=1 Tax=Amycolatopsis panacis TaxID=2340917 RepID=A0A419I9U2_9PSEU|nr:IS66 family transposase [Amycolatopsis panacis]RJQ89679.1 IS66 family transposase [Amycolatopsis panacis]